MIRVSVASMLSITQTEPKPTARSFGRWPTSIGRPSVIASWGSIFDTDLPSMLATHTAPSPTATDRGPASPT